MSKNATSSENLEQRELHKTEDRATAFSFLQRTGFIQRLHTILREYIEKKLADITTSSNIVLDLEIDLNELFNCNNGLFDKIIENPQDYLLLFQDVVNAEIVSKYLHTMVNCEFLIRTTKPSIHEGNSRLGKNGALSFFNDYVLTALSVKERNSDRLNVCFVNSTVESFSHHSHKGELIDKTKMCVTKSEGQTSLHTEKVSALFLNSKAFKCESGAMYTAIKCCIRDPLIKYLELGSQYHIWGYYNFDRPQEPQYEVLGLEKIQLYSIPTAINFIPAKIISMRSSIQNQYPNNPWAFVNYLALQFSYKDWTLRSYLSMRVALLLSLATANEETSVPILCIGKQPIQMAKLMNEISRAASRKISHSNHCNSLCGVIEKSEGNIWIRSGKLILATYGVYFSGDWEAIKLSHRREILSAISSKKIALSTESAKLSRPIPKTLTLTLKSIIWTYLYYDGNSKSLQDLMCEFGILFVAEPKGSTLDRFYSSSEKNLFHNHLSIEEIAQFLQYVNNRAVNVSEEAAHFINDYILTCRRMRGSKFPLFATDVLTTLAKGHARLSLREEVTYDDVLIITYFYEESWQYVYENGKISCPSESPYIHEQIALFYKDIIAFQERLKGRISQFLNR